MKSALVVIFLSSFALIGCEGVSLSGTGQDTKPSTTTITPDSTTVTNDDSTVTVIK